MLFLLAGCVPEPPGEFATRLATLESDLADVRARLADAEARLQVAEEATTLEIWGWDASYFVLNSENPWQTEADGTATPLDGSLPISPCRYAYLEVSVTSRVDSDVSPGAANVRVWGRSIGSTPYADMYVTYNLIADGSDSIYEGQAKEHVWLAVEDGVSIWVDNASADGLVPDYVEVYQQGCAN